MNEGIGLDGLIEAVLFASSEPVPRSRLVEVVGSAVEVDASIDRLKAFWKGRGGALNSTRSGFLLEARADLLPDDGSTEPTKPAIAALAAITFAGPIGMDDLASIRGRNVKPSVVSSLGDLVVSHKQSGRGRAVRFTAGSRLVRHLGVTSSDDLPTSEEAVELGRLLIEAETTPTAPVSEPSGSHGS